MAEGAPRFDGHSNASRLAAAGVQTTLIADSAVFAMMARANKVLVGAHAVLADGGIIAAAGMHLVALAAKRHAIPFVGKRRPAHHSSVYMYHYRHHHRLNGIVMLFLNVSFIVAAAVVAGCNQT